MQSSSKSLNENLTLKNYEKNVKDEIRSITSNLDEILKLLRV